MPCFEAMAEVVAAFGTEIELGIGDAGSFDCTEGTALVADPSYHCHYGGSRGLETLCVGPQGRDFQRWKGEGVD